jgi:D-sedoheptulose 7-phosphate isomerase
MAEPTREEDNAQTQRSTERERERMRDEGMSTTATVGSTIQESIEASVMLQQAILADGELLRRIEEAAEMILHALRKDARIFLAGNGGSAACAQRLAAKFLGQNQIKRRVIPAMALAANASAVTSIGNDYGFDQVFARQIEAFARPGDILVAITVSGDSRNVLRAVLMASALRVKTIALTGRSGGKVKNAVDLCLCVPSREMLRIQEAHVLLGHTILEFVEAGLARR